MFKTVVVGVDVHWCDLTVGAVQMSDQLVGTDGGISRVPVAESTEVDVVDRVDDLTFECLANSVVLSEQTEVFEVEPVMVGNGGGSRVAGGRCRAGSWVGRKDKGGVGECCVDGR